MESPDRLTEEHANGRCSPGVARRTSSPRRKHGWTQYTRRFANSILIFVLENELTKG
jgi:hypothetical protein